MSAFMRPWLPLTSFRQIASYAQERKCQLYPSSYEVTGSSSSAPSAPISKISDSPVIGKYDLFNLHSLVYMASEQSKTPESGKVSKPKSITAEPSVREKAAEDKIKMLQAQLAREKRKAPPERTSTQESVLLKSKASKLHETSLLWKMCLSNPIETNGPAARPVKGASLANPNKKARKYQALEFEDDE